MEQSIASTNAPGLSVRRVPIESLHPDPANPRTHDQKNIEAIKASLSRFDQVEPLVVQRGSGRIVGGHGRLQAMRELGWTYVDIVAVDLTDTQATALAIALNRSAELAGWDDGTLAKLLDSLRAEDELGGVGFSDGEIDELLAELEDQVPPAEIEDVAPEPPPKVPVSREGDLWVLEQSRLLCGDSTKQDDIGRLMSGDKAVLLSSDPPYCVGYRGNDRPNGSGKDWSDNYREVDIKDLGGFLTSVFEAVLPHIEDRAPLYVWHAHLQQPTIAAVFEKFDILLHQVLVWNKPTSVFGFSYYRWRHEPCAFGWRRGFKPKHGAEQLDSVWDVDWEGKSRVVGNEHPTQKPLRLFEIPMELHSRRGDVVLEPFSGSGSQLLAAERLGRKCRAMEISPAFVDVAVKRWQKATGREAIHEATGKTFAAVEAERKQGDGQGPG